MKGLEILASQKEEIPSDESGWNSKRKKENNRKVPLNKNPSDKLNICQKYTLV